MSGLAGQVHITNSTFTNNYYAAISVYAAPGSVGEIRHNGITVPAIWPAAVLAGLGNGATATSYGISAPYGGLYDITDNTIEGSTPAPTTNNVEQIGLDLGSNSLVHGGNRIRYLDQALNLTTNDQTGSSHDIEGNTFTDNLTGVAFSRFSNYPYYQAAVNVKLRCNTFSSTIAGATGVWVKAGAVFPAALGSANSPNGNRFDGIATANKRFVYEDAGKNFQYYRYMSVSGQEQLSGINLNGASQIFNYSGSTSTGVSPTPTIPGTNAPCGGSTMPGVNARTAISPSSSLANPLNPKIQLGEAYPNPAGEQVSFTYSLPIGGPPAVLVLRNLLGQQVAMQPLTQEGTGEVSLSVQHLPAGLYVGTVEVAGQVRASHKLTIVR